MILNLVNLLVGFCLMVISFAVFINYIRVNKINIFFFLLILNVGIRRFLFGLVSLGLIDPSNSSYMQHFIVMFLSPPLLLLCLKSFILSEPTRKELYIHSIVFSCIVFLRLILGEMSLFLIGILFTVYSLFYYSLLIKNYNYFKRQYQSIFTKQQLFKVKQLTIWIFALGINNFVFTTVYIFLNEPTKQETVVNMYHSSVVLWLFFLIYIFFNPSIIFNDVMKKNDPNRDFLSEFNLWNSKTLKKLDPQDAALALIVNKNIERLLEDLRKIKPELIIQYNSTDLMYEIAKHLKHPKSHLKFVMKYHCRFSQSDYLNLMRVIHSLTLMNNGYLENYTLETLREVCHFNSRTSFFRHFKKHLGVSPSRYITLMG
jgi:AraC-like DNA-binding protein